jgi:hypothetical protein
VHPHAGASTNLWGDTVSTELESLIIDLIPSLSVSSSAVCTTGPASSRFIPGRPSVAALMLSVGAAADDGDIALTLSVVGRVCMCPLPPAPLFTKSSSLLSSLPSASSNVFAFRFLEIGMVRQPGRGCTPQEPPGPSSHTVTVQPFVHAAVALPCGPVVSVVWVSCQWLIPTRTALAPACPHHTALRLG